MNMMKNMKTVYLYALVMILISACSSQTNPSPDRTKDVSEDPAVKLPQSTDTVTPIPTRTPEPTDTTMPSDTPFPTNTPTSISTPTKTSRPSATPTDIPEGVELVNLRTSDGCNLVGYLHRSDANPQRNLAVVLSHAWFLSHNEWEEFTPLFVENGFTTMTFDYRGHGASSCSDIADTIGVDVETVVKFLKNEGFEKVACIGVHRGALGCLAVTLLTEIDGLVMMSGAKSGIPVLEDLIPDIDRDIQNLTIPKIFMIAEQDFYGPEFVESFLEMAENAAEPKSIYVFPGDPHGIGLLIDEDVGEQVQGILLDFLIDLSQ